MNIARILFAALGLLGLFAAPSFAQATRGGGIEVGAGISYMTVVDPATRSAGGGVLLGGFGLLPITKTIALQPGIQWNRRTSQVTFPDSPNTDLTLDYINIPVMVRMPLFKGLHVVEGASFNFLAKASANDEDVKDQLKSNDISIVIGLGGTVGDNVSIEGRWDSGLRGVIEELGPNMTQIRNRAVMAVVGFTF